MKSKVKYFKRIVPHLENKYGAKKTSSIMSRALRRYEEIVTENKDEPKAYYIHTRDRIYPSIAMFDAMTAEGIKREETADFLVRLYRWPARLRPV